MRIITVILAVFSLNCVEAFSLKDKLATGHAGDYIVTAHASVYTVLILRSVTPESVVIEEIGAAEDVGSWRTWIEAGAPGCTSWTTYEIDVQTNRLLECYSHSQRTWLYPDDPNQFLPKLLALSLSITPQDDRRRIGPPPSDEEQDVRSLWLPPVVLEGKAIEKPQVIAWQGKWPHDDSLLSGCNVEFYVGPFPFPYWIDIKSPHYTAAIRAVDSGRALNSPMPAMPHRPPVFTGKPVWKDAEIELTLKCPVYHRALNLYILDLTESSAPIPVPCTVRQENQTATLTVREETLQPILQKGHKYQWLVVPKDSNGLAAESDAVFIW